MRKPKDMDNAYDLNNDGRLDDLELMGQAFAEEHPLREERKNRRPEDEDRMDDENSGYDLNTDGHLDEQELLGMAFGSPKEKKR